MLSPGLAPQWRLYTYELSDPTSVDKLLSFIQCQRKSVPDDKLIVSTKQDKLPKSRRQAAPNMRTSLKLQQSVGTTGSNKVSCPHCNVMHTLFMCVDYKALSLDSRWEKVRANKLCYNCFTREHTDFQCYSRGRCRK